MNAEEKLANESVEETRERIRVEAEKIYNGEVKYEKKEKEH